MKAANEALSADIPVTVTFDTLTAAKELRETGFDEPQAEAIVTTVHRAMSDTLATKTDLQSTKMDLESQLITTRTDLEAQITATRTDLEAQINALRTELKAEIRATNGRIDELKHSIDTLQDRIVLRLGGVMVTMTVLLMAIGPFYIRWVMSIIGAG